MFNWNWNWIKPTLANAPLAFLGFPASYGVAMFEQTVYPSPVNWVMAGAFESCYLGSIFFTQNKSRKMFFITIFSAALCGILYNSLHAAGIDGLLSNQAVPIRWLLALVHGAPLSAVCLSYAMLMHYGSNAKAEQSVPDNTTEEIDTLQKLLSDKDTELVRISQNYQRELTGMQRQLTNRNPDLSVYRERLIEIGKARLNKSQLEDAIDGLLAKMN